MDIKELLERVQNGENVYLNADCMEYLPHFPAGFFDLAICDPPYGINIGAMNMGAGNGTKTSNIKNRKWAPKKWDENKPDKEVFDEIFRISRNQIIWGGNYFCFDPCYGYIIWDKEIPVGLSFSDCEFAWHSFKISAKMFRYSAYLDKQSKFHPTQKPKALYHWLIENYHKSGQTILDPFVGSGNSLAVYEALGIQYVGFEIDPDYYRDSQKNIATYKAHFKSRLEEEIKMAGGQKSIFDL